MVIKRITETDDRAGRFINEAFTDYAIKSNVKLNFEEYCFAAENDEGEIIGVITGRAYYNEVHIGDLSLILNSGNCPVRCFDAVNIHLKKLVSLAMK